VSKKSKRTAGRVLRIKFTSRGDLLAYLHSQGVRWQELNKLDKAGR
jgi:hypothetical protein